MAFGFIEVDGIASRRIENGQHRSVGCARQLFSLIDDLPLGTDGEPRMSGEWHWTPEPLPEKKIDRWVKYGSWV